VNPRSLDDLKSSCTVPARRELLPETRRRRSACLKDVHIENAAKSLHEVIRSAATPETLVQGVATWPYLRIELARAEVEKLERASEASACRWRTGSSESRASLPKATRARAAVRVAVFRTNETGCAAQWLEGQESEQGSDVVDLCEQIMMGGPRLPVIRLTTIREESTNSDYTPVLSRIKPMPYAGACISMSTSTTCRTRAWCRHNKDDPQTSSSARVLARSVLVAEVKDLMPNSAP